MRAQGSKTHPKRRDTNGKTIADSHLGQQDQNMEDVDPPSNGKCLFYILLLWLSVVGSLPIALH